MEVYYRYVDGTTQNYDWEPVAELNEYLVIKRTECGVWIQIGNEGSIVNNKWEPKLKFILEHTGYNKEPVNKRFAWPTKQEALISYIKRKEKQVWLLENQLHNAKIYLTIAKTMLENN